MPLPLIFPALGALAGATGLSMNLGLDPTKWLKKGGDVITNTWDKFKNGDTNEVNKKIADQNLQFQYDNLEYQKALQQQIFDREDTAYERTITDMQNAGLNPMMMTGTNNAGEAIATQAPHNDFQKISSGMAEIAPYILDMANKKQDFDIGTSLQEKTQAEAESAKADAQVNLATAMDKIKNSKLDIGQKEYLLGDLARNMEFNSSFGIFNGMDERSRLSKMITSNNADFENKNPMFKWNDQKQEYELKWQKDAMTNLYKNSLHEFISDFAKQIFWEEYNKSATGKIIPGGAWSPIDRIKNKK